MENASIGAKGNGRFEPILSGSVLPMMLTLLVLFSSAAFAQNPSALNPTYDQLWTPNPELKFLEDDFRKIDKNGSPVDPKQFIPPKPFIPNWHKETLPIEMAYEVLWIKFDHEYGDAHDGINNRWSDRHDLKHIGHGAGHGEYYNPDGSAPLRYSEPVLYRNGTEANPVRPKFQVHILAKDPTTLDPFTLLKTADVRIKAHHVAGNADFTNTFHMITKTGVQFQNGIAVTPDGQGGYHPYVVFECTEAVPAGFDYTKLWLEFEIKNCRDDDSPTPNLVDGDETTWVRFDTTNRLDFYSVFATPSSQWETDGLLEPWVSALALLCYSAQVTGSGFDSVAAGVTNYLHSGHGLQYDEVTPIGRGTFVENEGLMVQTTKLKLAEYILAPGKTNVNCHDQALALTSLLNLVKGGSATARYHGAFGYILEAELVGGKRSNNPFYGDRSVTVTDNDGRPMTIRRKFDSSRVVGSDKIALDDDADGWLDRSFFTNHSWVRVGGDVYDACVGPITKKAESSYFSDAVDRSHNDELGVPLGRNPQTQAVVFQSMFAAVGAAQSYTFTIKPR